MVYSADGRNWRSATLPAVAKALPGRPIVPGSLTAFEGGFVVVGRDGSPDPYSQVVDSPLPPAMGRPAAWFSPNGIDWAKAEVPGQMVPGGELREVAAGANGLFAVGIGEAVDTQTHPVTHGWASKDGMTWTLVGRVGVDLPFIGDGFWPRASWSATVRRWRSSAQLRRRRRRRWPRCLSTASSGSR